MANCAHAKGQRQQLLGLKRWTGNI